MYKRLLEVILVVVSRPAFAQSQAIADIFMFFFLGVGIVVLIGAIAVARAIARAYSNSQHRPLIASDSIRQENADAATSQGSEGKGIAAWTIGVVIAVGLVAVFRDSALPIVVHLGALAFYGAYGAAQVPGLVLVVVIIGVLFILISARSRRRRMRADVETIGEADPHTAPQQEIIGHFPPEILRLMLENSISFDGKQFCFAGYKYDKLEDAVAFASIQKMRRQERG